MNMYVYVYVYICICTYVRMHVCMSAHIHNQDTYQVIGEGGFGRAYRVMCRDDTVRVIKCELEGEGNMQDLPPLVEVVVVVVVVVVRVSSKSKSSSSESNS